MRSIEYTSVARLREHRRLVAAAGADFQHLARVPCRCISTSIMRATTYGCEMVWPKPIGSAVSS